MNRDVTELDIAKLEWLLHKRGQPTSSMPVSQETIDKWTGILPNRLLYFWRELGWCSFRNGLLWLVNPDDYDAMVETWLEGCRCAELDTFHCYARTAFGELLLYGQHSRQFIDVTPQQQSLWADERNILKRQSEENADISIGTRLCGDDERYDFRNYDGKPLFPQALAKLGELQPNEMYAFEPFLVTLPDEKITVDSLAKVRMDVQLDILRQFGGQPQLMNELFPSIS